MSRAQQRPRFRAVERDSSSRDRVRVTGVLGDMDYAIIRVGNKQHRVRDGETLVVDRVSADEGSTLAPDVLLRDDGVDVTLTVLAHERGPKIRIGKYRRRTGYKRHNGFRAATSRIEVSLGGKKVAPAEKAEPKQEA